ncbi:hypothetical protein EPH_0006120 [Eimeria praecox]|uniref:Uncharacterized protein n=1 Tax=Eimeria praecox TaxID=51316 RepID=U6G682_9EIME|nr:hypothetical protein EPH_0006120 [Eimeria praecox]
MQAAIAAEPDAPPASLLSWGKGAWQVSPEEIGLPVPSASVSRRRNGGFRGLSFSVVGLAAVAVVAAAYLVLRCALYLTKASSSSSKGALRYLAEAEERTNEDPEEPCGAAAGNPPASAGAAKEEEEDEEAPVEEELLKRVNLYVNNLEQLIRKNEWVVNWLSRPLRSRCIAEFVCLSLVELSALLSLLEKGERTNISKQVERISNLFYSLRYSLGKMDVPHARSRHIKYLHALFRKVINVTQERTNISEQVEGISDLFYSLRYSLGKMYVPHARSRHIKYLHALFRKVINVTPATEALSQKERLLKIKHLVLVQEVALEHFRAAMRWLNACIRQSNKGKKGPKRAAQAVKGGARHPETTTTTEDDVSARLESVIVAIEETSHKRREQVFRDPGLSRWLREEHTKGSHYGIMSAPRIEKLTQMPLQTHRERLEDLQSTLLGSGKEPWEQIKLKDARGRQAAAPSSAAETPARGGNAPPSDSPGTAPLAHAPTRHRRQGPSNGADNAESVPASASSSTSTEAPIPPPPAADAAAAVTDAGAVAAAKGKIAVSNAPRHKGVPRTAMSSALTRVSLSGASEPPAVSAMSAAPQRAPASSALRGASPSVRTLGVRDMASVGVPSHSPQPPKSMLRPSHRSFRTAASPTVALRRPRAFSLAVPRVAAQALDASAASVGRVASAASLSALDASAASHPSAAASALPHGFEWAPGAQRPLLRAPLEPQRDAASNLHPSSASTGWELPLQTAWGDAWGDASSLRNTGIFDSGSSALLLATSASNPLLASFGRPAESRSSAETPEGEMPVDVYGSPLTFRVWGLEEGTPGRPEEEEAFGRSTGALLPSDAPRPTSPETIAAGFDQLKKLFSGASHQEPGSAP